MYYQGPTGGGRVRLEAGTEEGRIGRGVQHPTLQAHQSDQALAVGSHSLHGRVAMGFCAR